MAFKITANPKFDANLTFTAQGADLKCKVTFRHMGRKAFESLFATVFDNRKDPVGAEADAVLAVVDSWDIECPLDNESVEKLCDEYPGFGVALLQGYQKAFVTHLKGN